MERQTTLTRLSNLAYHNGLDMLPIPSVKDMDAGVSSGSSAISTGSSTPNSSRRSSIYGEKYECLTLNRAMEQRVYFRQVSFDDGNWEKTNIKCGEMREMENTFCDSILCSIISRQTRDQAQFMNNKDQQVTVTKKKRHKAKLTERRRLSVANRSKVVGMIFLSCAMKHLYLC